MLYCAHFSEQCRTTRFFIAFGSYQFEIDSASSSGGAPPNFTAATATVSPGSSAAYSVTLPSSVISAIAAGLSIPLLVLPMAFRRRKAWKAKAILSVCAVLMLMIGVVVVNGCGGGGTVTGPQTHLATDSGTVTLIVQ
jgi:hypothetical protein